MQWKIFCSLSNESSEFEMNIIEFCSLVEPEGITYIWEWKLDILVLSTHYATFVP